jgi:hypothetical protein
LVLEAQLIPLQSFALRTRCGSPHGGPRPLEVVAPALESDFTAKV